jgi:hypothetical protein
VDLPCSSQGGEDRGLGLSTSRHGCGAETPREAALASIEGISGAQLPSQESHRDLQRSLGAFNPSMGVPNVIMAKGGMGSDGSMGGSATMERGRPSFVMPTPTVQGPKLDDGGSGGDIGKIIHNGEQGCCCCGSY